MKVCLLNDSFPPVIDGVANVVMNYGRLLSEEGNEVLVGTPRYPDVSYDGYPYRVLPYRSFDTTKLVSGYRAGNPLEMKAVEDMAAFAPDVIHTHCPVASTVVARLLRNELKKRDEGAEPPLIFTYHTKFDVDIARAVKSELLQKESAKALVDNISACDEVWVVSRGAGENLKALGFAGGYRVMANGVDFPKGSADKESVEGLNESYDLPSGVPVFLFVGRMMKYKGLPIIIGAMRRLAEAGVDYRMVFVGGGADLGEMRALAEAYGLAVEVYAEAKDACDADAACVAAKEKEILYRGQGTGSGKLIFAGPEHDRNVLRAWNTRADVFLFPSTYDTNGIVVREAAACGLASVLIKDSCAAEGITDGRNGFLLDVDICGENAKEEEKNAYIRESAEAMAALLQRLCREPERMREAGARAMDEIYISWDESVKAAYARYEELIALKESGVLPAHRPTVSDELLRAAGALAKGTEMVFSVPKSIYMGTERALDASRRGIIHGVETLHHGTEQLYRHTEEAWDSFREGMLENAREAWEELSEAGENAAFTVRGLKDGAKERLRQIRDKR